MLVKCEPPERLELAGEDVGSHGVGEVRPESVVALIVEAFEGRFRDGPVHPIDLSVSPRMLQFGEPVLDVVGLTDRVEPHLTRPGCVAVARLPGKLDAIVG